MTVREWILFTALVTVLAVFGGWFFRKRFHHRGIKTLGMESEESFRLMIKSIKDYAIIMLNPGGQIISWNAGAERFKGYTAAEIIGQHFSRFYPLEDVKSGKPEMELEVAAREGRFEEEGWRVRKDGSLFWASVVITALREKSGKLLGYAKVTRDLTERMRAEKELQWKTALLEAQVNASLDGIMVIDEDNKKIIQNRRVDELWKIPREISEDPNGRRQLDWVKNATNNPAEFLETVLHLKAHPNEMARGELELKDGTILDRYSAPVIGKDGERYGRITTFRDITERKRVEVALQKSEARKNAIVLSALDGVVTFDQEGRILEFNPAAEKIFGYARADVLKQEFAGLFLPLLERDQHRRDLQEYGETGRSSILGQRTESTALRYDGSEFSIESAVVRMGIETPPIFTAFIRDITGRKRAEEKLKRLGLEHELVLNSVGEGVHWIGIDGRIKFENPAGAHMLGYEPNELVGQLAHQTMHHTRVDGTPYPIDDCFVYATIRTGTPHRVKDEIFWRKDGTSFPVEYTSTPVRDENGRLAGTVVVFIDITERKRIETRLLQSQKMETVGKLAGGVAHEFNSILTAIIGQSELLLQDIPPESPLVKNATEIRQAADRAAALTRQLLAYGRKQILQPEVLDLNLVLAEMESTLNHLMRDARVRIVPAIGLRMVKIDPGQMEQVIVNIAMNAATAMPNGGELVLETSNTTLDENFVRPFPGLIAGDYVLLTISDTGTGMKEETKAHAFEPFYSIKGVGQGTGLGLATCYGILKQSGGHINVYSELGRGSTFKIYLPEFEPPKKVIAPRAIAGGLPGGTETILLAEDDPALLEMSAALLRKLGYTVLTASNGIEALGLGHQRDVGHIDLLFTDVVMPHMSGNELSDRIHAIYPHTKVLFTSAYTENAIVHQGILNKGVVLLQKPFTPSALAHKIREILDR
jgi:two-component system cell cycle sensor histidine kinase/response regulator CckA